MHIGQFAVFIEPPFTCVCNTRCRLTCTHFIHTLHYTHYTFFHYRLKTYLFHKSYPPSFTSSSRTASSDFSWSVSSELLGFWFDFSLIFRFWAVRCIKLAIPSAFERTLTYHIVSYRRVDVHIPARDKHGTETTATAAVMCRKNVNVSKHCSLLTAAALKNVLLIDCWRSMKPKTVVSASAIPWPGCWFLSKSPT